VVMNTNTYTTRDGHDNIAVLEERKRVQNNMP